MRTWRSLLRQLTVFVAVTPPSLLRLIGHLLEDQPEFRIVGRATEARSLVRLSGRLAPDLIVTSIRLLGREKSEALFKVRRSSPDSRLILIHPFRRVAWHLVRADAHVPEESLVRCLVPAARSFQ